MTMIVDIDQVRHIEKPPTRPSTLAFEMKFEELSVMKDGSWHAGFMDGTAHITYDRDSGDWWVDEISLRACNRKVGAEAKSRMLTVDPLRDRDLYDIIYKRFLDKHSTRVEERAQEMLAEDAL
jgi:hypothetical protein